MCYNWCAFRVPRRVHLGSEGREDLGAFGGVFIIMTNCFEFYSQSMDKYTGRSNRQNGSLILFEYIIYNKNGPFE